MCSRSSVNQVGRGHAALDERQVIVFHRDGSAEEVRLVAHTGRGLVDQIFQPRSGLLVAFNVQVGVPDHVFQEERLYLLQRSILLPYFGQVARAVNAVGIGPVLDRLFPIGPQQPNAVAIPLLPRS